MIWGAAHGALIGGYHLWQKVKFFQMPSVLAKGLTFIVIVFTWVLFRSQSFGHALEMFKSMFGAHGYKFDHNNLFPNCKMKLPILLATIILIQFMPNMVSYVRDNARTLNYSHAVAGGLVFAVAILWMGTSSVFLYFQF